MHTYLKFFFFSISLLGNANQFLISVKQATCDLQHISMIAVLLHVQLFLLQ